MNKIQIITLGAGANKLVSVRENTWEATMRFFADCLLDVLADGFLIEPHATGEMIPVKTDGPIVVNSIDTLHRDEARSCWQIVFLRLPSGAADLESRACVWLRSLRSDDRS